MDPLTRLEIEHTCRESGNTFQRRARLMQSIWREERGYPMGISTDANPPRPIGSVLEAGWAEESLANFLTDTIRDVVRAEVLDPVRSHGKLYGRPRIFQNLLSSQPLCFNLFGELQRDLPLATDVMSRMTDGRVREVTGIDFEHSPGRGDPTYIGDSSAFDVFIRFRNGDGRRGFIGIECKYHEDLKGGGDHYRDLYARRASEMGCFHPDRMSMLRKPRLQQIWRDHLLAGATRMADGYGDGLFVVLRPTDNAACADAVAEYRSCLTDEDTFAEWLLEDMLLALRLNTDDWWVEQFNDRYLAFDKVDVELARLAADGRDVTG